MNNDNLESINLNENQVMAAQLIITGMTGKEVADHLGVTPETISRWRQMPAFRLYVDELLVDFKETVRQRLAPLFLKALYAVEQFFDDPDASPKDKFTAGVKVLEFYNLKEIDLQSRKTHPKFSNEKISEIIRKLSDEQLNELIDGKKDIPDFVDENGNII